MAALEGLGVRVALGERIGPHEEGDMHVVLGSGGASSLRSIGMYTIGPSMAQD